MTSDGAGAGACHEQGSCQFDSVTEKAAHEPSPMPESTAATPVSPLSVVQPSTPDTADEVPSTPIRHVDGSADPVEYRKLPSLGRELGHRAACALTSSAAVPEQAALGGVSAGAAKPAKASMRYKRRAQRRATVSILAAIDR